MFLFETAKVRIFFVLGDKKKVHVVFFFYLCIAKCQLGNLILNFYLFILNRLRRFLNFLFYV